MTALQRWVVSEIHAGDDKSQVSRGFAPFAEIFLGRIIMHCENPGAYIYLPRDMSLGTLP